MWRWLGISLIFIFLQDYTHSLRLVEVRIPNYVVKGSAAQLECLYDLDGEALYSVKWYKDGNEFYRYVPRDMPPAQTFLLPGVSVELHNSSDAIVTLRNVNLQSAGRFRCEVSGEAPSFQTVTEHGDMIVVSLPDQGPPKISGGRPRYQIGDWVRVNCTVGRSKPAVQLSWFVNGEPAEPHTLRKYETIISGREGLETSVLGLQFRVEQHHFRNGDMKLKCVASLSTLYWRSNEESVEGDRPQKAPVLESRETVYASNSRADPVQASKTDSHVVAHAPNVLWLLLAACLASTCLEQLQRLLLWQRLYAPLLLLPTLLPHKLLARQQASVGAEEQKSKQRTTHKKAAVVLMAMQQENFINENQSNLVIKGYLPEMPQQRQRQRGLWQSAPPALSMRQQHKQLENVCAECKRIYKVNELIIMKENFNEEMLLLLPLSSSFAPAAHFNEASANTPSASCITATASAAAALASASPSTSASASTSALSLLSQSSGLRATVAEKYESRPLTALWATQTAMQQQLPLRQQQKLLIAR